MATTDGTPDRYTEGYRQGYRDAVVDIGKHSIRSPEQVEASLKRVRDDQRCPSCGVKPGQAHWDNCGKIQPFAHVIWNGP